MTKADLALLERAFEAEVQSAFAKAEVRAAFALMQARSKRAAALCEHGYLERRSVTLPGRFPVTIEGYALTGRGRFAYCTSCTKGTGT